MSKPTSAPDAPHEQTAGGASGVLHPPVWEPDRLNRAEHIIRRALTRLSAEIRERAAEAGEKDAQRMQKAAAALQTRSALTRALPELQAHPALTQRMEDFDRDPYVLNTPGGLVDLRTGRLLGPDPGALCARCTSVAPEPGKPTEWLSFLQRAFPDDPTHMPRYVQRLAGYVATGLNVEKLAWAFVGPSDTGKSVALNVLSGVLGSYAATIPHGALTGPGGGHPTELSFVEARLGTSSEVPSSGARWQGDRFKAITGGDSIAIRGLYQDYRTVKPRSRLIMASNHVPSASNDPAILRRILIVPFRSKIPLEEQDPHLTDRLLEDEGGRILSWIIEGARDYLAHGLGSLPHAVQDATAAYRENEDHLSSFLRERCVLAPDLEDSTESLWQEWRTWCDESGLRREVGTVQSFTQMMKQDGPEHGISYSTNCRVDDRRARGFKGVTVKPVDSFRTAEDVGERLDPADEAVRRSREIHG